MALDAFASPLKRRRWIKEEKRGGGRHQSKILIHGVAHAQHYPNINPQSA